MHNTQKNIHKRRIIIQKICVFILVKGKKRLYTKDYKQNSSIPTEHSIERKERIERIMIKAGIIGATGYAGGELVRILMGHKDVEIKWYGSRSYIDQKYAAVYQNMFQIVEDVCKDDNMEELADQVDVIFTATPRDLAASL